MFRTLCLSLLSLSLAAAVLVASPPAVAQDSGPLVERAQGADRFATAAAISARTFDPADVDTVYLSTGLDFADALAAGTSAALLGGPVLLTLPDFVPPPISAEIDRLGPERVVLVGGTNAIGPEVAAAMSAYNVERIGGVDRFETAANLALDAFDPDDVDVVFLATGGGFADALAGVPAAHLRGAPLLLAIDNFLPPATAAAIDTLDPTEVVVLGGLQAIGGEVVNDLQERGLQVNRISGQDRFATADQVARVNFMGAREIFVASGLGFADALAGGAAVASDQGALLLSTDDLLLPGTASVIADLNPRRVTVLGGQNAVADSVLDQIRDALAGSTALPDGAIPDLLLSGGPGSNDPQALYAATLDGAFELMTSPPPGRSDLSADWSPDGRRVSFMRIEIPGATNAQPHIMDFVAGPGSIRPLTDAGECDGFYTRATWRPATEADALLIQCRLGDDFSNPDSTEMRVQPLTGAGTDIVQPDGLTYLGARWAPDGRLSVLAENGDGDHEIYLLEDADWSTGNPGELVTDQVRGLHFMWVGAQGGDVLVTRDRDGDDLVLNATIAGGGGYVTEELFRGLQEGSSGREWEIRDTHPDRGVLIASDGRHADDVMDLVPLDAAQDPIRVFGPDDYQQSRANSLSGVQFLSGGNRVVAGEVRFRGEVDGGFSRISDARIQIVDLDNLNPAVDNPVIFGDWAFVIPDAVNPVGFE